MSETQNKGGRPSKYDEKYIAEADLYIEQCQDVKRKVKLPTIEGFARYIGVNKTTLYEWEQDHPLFSNALDNIRTEQQERLINNGLSGDYNSTIAKLILSSNHGMVERKETDMTTKGESLNEGVTKILQKVYDQGGD